METMVELVDSHHGIYVPKIFGEQFADDFEVKEEDREILIAGPDHEDYWETWDDVLMYAKHEEDMPSAREWTLHQNEGDLWAVRDDHVWEDE